MTNYSKLGRLIHIGLVCTLSDVVRIYSGGTYFGNRRDKCAIDTCAQS